MNKLTIGEYFTYLMDQMTLHPEISSQPLYSPEGIPFGFEDHEETAKRFGVTECEVRVMINKDLVEGIKSNAHIIVPKNASKPEPYTFPNFLEGYEDDDRTSSGLISE